MILEMLEKQAAGVQTAADQFRQVAFMLDKTGAAPELKYFSHKNPESNVYALERTAPGGVTELLAQADKPRVAQTTNNPQVEQFNPAPPTDGRAGRQSAQSDSSVGVVDPLKNDPTGDSKLKTAAGFREGYGIGRRTAKLKSLGKKVKEIKGDDGGASKTVSEVKEMVKDMPISYRTGHHLGEHRNKYLAGGGVAAVAGGTAVALKEKKPKKDIRKAAAKLIAEGRIRKEALAIKPLAGALQTSAKQARKVGVPKAIKSPQMGPIQGFLKSR